MHFHIDSQWHKPEYVDSTIANIEKNRIIVAAQACSVPSYEETLEISKRSDFIFPAFGILPWYAHEYVPQLDSIEIPLDEVGMLGEIGLDYRSSPPEATPDLQKALFEFFLEAAEKHDLAMNLHVRSASDDTLEMVTSYNVNRVISHSHSDSLESMRAMADNGFYFTIDPVIVSNRDSQRIQLMRDIAKEVPSDLLLTEVDTLPRDTYKPPSDLLNSLLEFLAKLRTTSYDELVETIQKNSLRLMKGISQLEPYIKFLE